MRARGGRISVTDGPYAESKELVGGYIIISAKDYDEACRIAESNPHFKYGGNIAVRQVDAVSRGTLRPASSPKPWSGARPARFSRGPVPPLAGAAPHLAYAPSHA